MEEKRMAGTYEIFQAISVGHIEVIMGEDRRAAPGEKFMCAFCETNDMFETFKDAMVSDEYTEILQLFGQRIEQEAARLHDEIMLNPSLKIDDSPVFDTGFTPVTDGDDLRDKVVIIKPDTLKREYQRATHQYMLVKGGFGASANSRGTKVYCTDLFSGRSQCFSRYDILGTVSEEQMPRWAKDGLLLAEKEKEREDAR